MGKACRGNLPGSQGLARISLERQGKLSWQKGRQGIAWGKLERQGMPGMPDKGAGYYMGKAGEACQVDREAGDRL